MKLREFREASNPPITQLEMAKLLGVTDSCISRYESGDTLPSLPKAMAIEKLTNGKVTFKDFITDASAMAIEKLTNGKVTFKDFITDASCNN